MGKRQRVQETGSPFFHFFSPRHDSCNNCITLLHSEQEAWCGVLGCLFWTLHQSPRCIPSPLWLWSRCVGPNKTLRGPWWTGNRTFLHFAPGVSTQLHSHLLWIVEDRVRVRVPDMPIHSSSNVWVWFTSARSPRVQRQANHGLLLRTSFIFLWGERHSNKMMIKL